jgi:tRNA-Thr(GGU) m(6)t(6)A37 methyltransferase TsaA
MMEFTPVAYVKNSRNEPVDDNWGNIISEIALADNVPADALIGIDQFSHLEIIYCFDKVKKEDAVFSARPRGNPDFPLIGVFAQRKKDRPNPIGLCRVELLEHHGRTLKVKGLDAINGTPVLDIKPVYKEFDTQIETRQPGWVSELMKDYWK